MYKRQDLKLVALCHELLEIAVLRLIGQTLNLISIVVASSNSEISTLGFRPYKNGRSMTCHGMSVVRQCQVITCQGPSSHLQISRCSRFCCCVGSYKGCFILVGKSIMLGCISDSIKHMDHTNLHIVRSNFQTKCNVYVFTRAICGHS